ncbi:MAG: sigma 54-interacting transcriptional regulator [Deltaproteobacteria bacterium]|nr:sigma 54-interacting transcriptional regulator [Deltaproteobacteria bacterium]
MREDAVASHELPASGEVVIGRGQDAQIRIDHPSVSRSHVALQLGERVTVRDLESSNGTSLRGARLPAGRPVEIGTNEVFVVGDVPVVVQERRTAAMPTSARPAAPSTGPAIAPICADPAMKNLFDLAGRVAVGTISVLVTGESGAGKEVLARAIHAASPRARGPLVEVNCAAISEQLIESELFGHERGSFTGAAGAKAGLIEAGSGGTVFLDEVGELSATAQAKLLRVLEDRRVLRVGATEARTVDVRFVAATNRDLEAEVAAGQFRGDLYYRLAGVVLEVPPLRERRADIEPLTRAFAAVAAQSLGRAAPQLPAETMAAIVAHDWPGNVRELRNAIERAVLLGGDTLTAAEVVGRSARVPARPATATEPPVGDDERARIMDALDRCAGNQTRAADLLGMPRRTLVKRLVQYGIPRPKRG